MMTNLSPLQLTQARTQKSMSAHQQPMAELDFQKILGGQEVQAEESVSVSSFQKNLVLQKKIIAADSLEDIPLVANAAKLVAKEWTEEGKMPSFEELAALLGMEHSELAKSLQTIARKALQILEKEIKENTGEEGGLPFFVDYAIPQAGGFEVDVLSEVQEGQLNMGHLLHVLQLLTVIPEKEWTLLEPKALEQVLQAGKLWQLSSRSSEEEADKPLQAVMKDAERKLTEKIEAALLQPLAEKRAAVLQKAFTHYGQMLQPGSGAFSLESVPEQVAETDTQVPTAGETAKQKEQIQLSLSPSLHFPSRTESWSISVQTNPKPMNIDQFIEKFSQVLNKSNMVQTLNGTKLILRLYPEQLGSLRVELLQQNGVMTAKILSSTSAVNDLLEQNAASLKQAFAQQHVSVDKVEFVFGQPDPQKFERQPHQEHQQHSEKKEQEAHDTHADDEPKESFQELLLNVEV